MGISSARPDNLDDFAKASRRLDRTLATSRQRVLNDYEAFVGANHWGEFNADSLLAAYGRYLNGNGFTARWVAGIAAAFRAAGGGGGLVRLPDAAIKASLRAAGLDHGRHHVTFDKPVAYGSPPTTGYTNDPVNTATGNFVEIETDLACSGLLEDLTFARTYNSRSDRVGPFGRAWSSWATARLLPGPDGAAYVGPDGQEALFPRMGEGYGRVIGVNARVEPLECGLALHWVGGAVRWVFDEAGRPVSTSRGPGTEVRLAYDAGGRLAELAHAGGRHVGLRWDKAGERILAVECSDGRRTTYLYDDDANLVGAESGGATRRYALDEAGRVVSVIDADGVAELVNTYDESGRVLQQLSPFGRRTHIAYLPGRVTVTSDGEEDGPVNAYIHDEHGRLLGIVDGDDQQMSMSYDEWGNLTAITERGGAVTLQDHDELGRPVRRVLPSGATYSFVHDDADRLVEVAVSTGAVTRLSYDGDERSPAEVVDPEGGVMRQTVRDGLVRRIVDPDGIGAAFEHDADGNVVAVTDDGGNTQRVERDAAGRVIAQVSPLGRRTTFFYDADGRLVERHDPAGGVWRHEYTAAGRLLATIDPTGIRTAARYGEHGEPVAALDGLGQATTGEYDRFGNVVGVVEPGGAAWRYAYDTLMRPVAAVDPTGARWEREFNVDGLLTAEIDPTGRRVSTALDQFGRVVGIDDGAMALAFELDELGRVVAETHPDGTRARAEYDLCGRRTLFADATGAVTRSEYTPAGRLARTVLPSGRTETFEYDACGRLAASIDGAGRRWEQRYDADGAIVERGLPTGEVERLEYDEAGRPLRRVTPGAGVTAHEYDPAGRLLAQIDREYGERRFAYDGAERVVAATDANGETTRYDYDERGLVTQVTDPLGGRTSRGYDDAGRLIEQIDQLGRSVTAAYDAAGRLLERSDAAGRRIARQYDVAGRLRAFGPVGAEPTTIAYDTLERTVRIDEPGAPPSALRWDAAGRLVERSRGELALRWSYDADGERAAVAYPDGTETAYLRDEGGYVTAVRHPGLGSIALERDAAGRLVGAQADDMRARWSYDAGALVRYELHAAGTDRTAQLTRDPIGRVVRALVDGQEHDYGYDAAGQLVSAAGPAGARAFEYDANGRLVRETTPAGAIAYEYDAAGELLTRAGADGTVTSFDYDAAGCRVRESDGELERRYDWDAFGRLAQIDATGPAGEPQRTTRLTVDALGELAELDGMPLLWDSAQPLSPLAWHAGAAVIGEGAPWAMAGAGATQWLAPDWQGTPAGPPRDPWGAPIGADASPGAHLGYRGELEFEGETWLRARAYQPSSRAFLAPDPLPPVPGTPAAANPHHYAANDPIGRADPLGLRPVTEAELQGLRDRMGRGSLGQVGEIAMGVIKAQVEPFIKVGGVLVKYSGEISAVTGVIALACPALAPVLGPVSLAFGAVSVIDAAVKGDKAGVVLGVVGLVPGARGIILAKTATNKAAFAAELSRKATSRAFLDGPAVTAGRHALASNTVAESADLARRAHNADVLGTGISLVDLGRKHGGPWIGRQLQPLTR